MDAACSCLITLINMGQGSEKAMRQVFRHSVSFEHDTRAEKKGQHIHHSNEDGRGHVQLKFKKTEWQKKQANKAPDLLTSAKCPQTLEH